MPFWIGRPDAELGCFCVVCVVNAIYLQYFKGAYHDSLADIDSFYQFKGFNAFLASPPIDNPRNILDSELLRPFDEVRLSGSACTEP